MKKLVRIWILLIPAMWISYMGLAFLISKGFGRDFDFLEKGIIAALFCIIFPLAQWIGYSYSVFPRIKYLENSDIAKPTFKDACSSTVNTHQEFDFACLKTEIAEKWIITFSDDVEKVIKFRTKMSFSSWGAATWLKYDSEVGKLYLVYFSIATSVKSDARKIQKEVEKCFTF